REAAGLVLGRVDRDAGHEAGAHPAVVAHAIDVEARLGGRSVELEEDGAAAVDANVGGEALDARIAGAADVPLRGGIAGETVLGLDGGCRGGAGGNGWLRTGEQEESAREKHFRPPAVEAAVGMITH